MARSRSMRRGLIATAVVATAVVVPAAWALLAETPVLKATANELIGAVETESGSGDELIVFSRSRAGKPNVYDAYLRRSGAGGKTTRKLNTQGRGFGWTLDGSRAAYQQIVRGRSNIKFYDVTTGVRSNPPSGVNTSSWEYQPKLGSGWMTFIRQAGRVNRLWLFNLTTHETRLLATTTRWAHAIFNGQIAGDWAVWARCAPRCVAYRYAISTGTKQTIPGPNTTRVVHQYAASVTPAGIVYLVRSGNDCGLNVRIVRFFAAGDPATGTVVAALPARRDSNFSHARVNGDGSTDVFYTRGRCTQRSYMDVYKVTDPAP